MTIGKSNDARGRRPGAAIGLVAGLGLLATAGAMHAASPTRAPYLQNFPNFAPNLAATLPGNIDTQLKSQLEAAQKFAQVQREFDLYSWQMFLALAWPTNNQGQPAPRITDLAFGAPRWTTWHNSSEIFRTDGARPAACGRPGGAHALALQRDISVPVSRRLPLFTPRATAATEGRSRRFLGVVSAVGELNGANMADIDQAFSGPLIDQNGEYVFYEIMIDPNEVDYLCKNGLYNINGQLAFTKGKDNVAVVMPAGTEKAEGSGSFELKFAWKVLKPGTDDFTRFFTMPATIMDPQPGGGTRERDVTVGLVGMHIGHKSETTKQWIWSTFEQVDNLDVDPIAHPNLHPSFSDPNCPLCAVNVSPPPDGNGGYAYSRTPVQAWRSVPIPGDKKALNAQAQAVLARMGSVWQYYQLIDTQWPIHPNVPPARWNGALPDAVANKPGGDPTPVYLTNITMETYFQGGNQSACRNTEAPDGFSCPSDPPSWNSTLNNSTKPVVGTQGIGTMIFASESCTGCHSSAGLYVAYDPKTGQGRTSGQLMGDFSWLLTHKANYEGGALPAAPVAAIRRGLQAQRR